MTSFVDALSTGSDVERFDRSAIASLVADLEAAQLPPPPVRKKIRTNSGATLRDCAGVLRTTPETVRRWEAGLMTPRREHAIAYRQLLDKLSAT